MLSTVHVLYHLSCPTPLRKELLLYQLSQLETARARLEPRQPDPRATLC